MDRQRRELAMYHKSLKTAALIALFASLCTQSPVRAEDTPAMLVPQPAVTSVEAWKAGWPQAPGPTHNYAALDTGVPLVKQLAEGKIVWRSEARIPRGKAYSAIDNRMGTAGWPSGGGYNLLMADGRLLHWHYLPDGERARHPSSGRAMKFDRNIAPTADLRLVAVDPANGATLWRRILPRQVRTFAGGKSVDPQNGTPACADGRIHALSKTGVLYAFSIADGSLIWEHPINRIYVNEAAALAARRLKNQVSGSHVHGSYLDRPLLAVDGVVLVSLPDVVLAFAGDSGTPVWKYEAKTARYSFPLPWQAKAGMTVLLSDDDGIHCVRVRDGRRLWFHAGIPAQSRLFRKDDLLIVQGERVVPTINRKKPEFVQEGSLSRGVGTPAGYRLGESGLKRLWGTVDRFDGTPGSLELVMNATLPVVLDDKLFVISPLKCTGGKRFKEGESPTPGSLQGDRTEDVIGVHGSKDGPKGVRIYDLETGKLLGQFQNHEDLIHRNIQWQRIGPRALAMVDLGHESQQYLFPTLAPKPTIGAPIWQSPWGPTVTYDHYMSHPLIDGRWMVRTSRDLLCYDLRADGSVGHTPTVLSSPEWASGLPMPYRNLADPHLRKRGAAIAALGEDATTDLNEAAIRTLMEHGDRSVREAVRRVIQTRRDATADVPSLTWASELLEDLVMNGEGDSAYEVAAAMACSPDGPNQKTHDALREAAVDRSRPVSARRAAILAWVGRGDAKAVAHLVPLLDDPVVRIATARALGVIADGTQGGVLALAVAADDEDAPLAYTAAEALRHCVDRGVAGDPAILVQALPSAATVNERPNRNAILRGAAALGEPGREYLLAVLDSLGANARKNIEPELGQSLIGALRMAGIPTDHPSLQRAAEINDVLGKFLHEYAQLDEYPYHNNDELPASYHAFWQDIDGEAAFNGDPQPAW
jgi:outer membrane protein assembly factor BamB